MLSQTDRFSLPGPSSQTVVFDPEDVGHLSEEEDLDEAQFFKKKALSRDEDQGDSSSNQDQEEIDLVGKKVVAHKGKLVPCWFPGIVKSICSKGVEVEFFSNLGSHVCTRKNVMLFSAFKGKKKSSALYKVPSTLKRKFSDALAQIDV